MTAQFELANVVAENASTQASHGATVAHATPKFQLDTSSTRQIIAPAKKAKAGHDNRSRPSRSKEEAVVTPSEEAVPFEDGEELSRF